MLELVGNLKKHGQGKSYKNNLNLFKVSNLNANKLKLSLWLNELTIHKTFKAARFFHLT